MRIDRHHFTCFFSSLQGPPWRDRSWTVPREKNPVWARERSGWEAEPKQTDEVVARNEVVARLSRSKLSDSGLAQTRSLATLGTGSAISEIPTMRLLRFARNDRGHIDLCERILFRSLLRNSNLSNGKDKIWPTSRLIRSKLIG